MGFLNFFCLLFTETYLANILCISYHHNVPNTIKNLVLQPLIVHSLQSGIQDNVTFDIGTCSFCSIKRKWDKFCNFWLLIHRTYSLKTMFLCTLSTNTLPKSRITHDAKVKRSNFLKWAIAMWHCNSIKVVCILTVLQMNLFTNEVKQWCNFCRIIWY